MQDGTYVDGKRLQSLFEAFPIRKGCVIAVGHNVDGKPTLNHEIVIAAVRLSRICAIEYSEAAGVWQGETEKTTLLLVWPVPRSDQIVNLCKLLRQDAIYIETEKFRFLVWANGKVEQVK